MTLENIDIKSALIGAIATVLIMALCTLPYFVISGIERANDRYEKGQKAMIDRHKLENKGVLK